MVVAFDKEYQANDKEYQAKNVSYVQTGAVIDALYTKGESDADEVNDLGATIHANRLGDL